MLDEVTPREWPMWEVFIRSQHGLAHKHVGSLHAANSESALQHARDVYTRRNEGVSIWVVAASDVVASSPEDKAALFDPAQSKVFRHPTFFPTPDGVEAYLNAMTAKFEYLLRLGDNCLVLSQQLSAWCGHGPALEEDLALTNTALDLLGQARLWLSYAGEIEGAGRDEDALAYHRDAHEFRNLLIVEQPNGHYGNTIARQFLFDVWHQQLLAGLCQSSASRIADIAQKSVKESRYHVERSAGLMVALGDGTALSHERMQGAINKLWPYAHEWFEPDAVDEECARDGLCPAAISLEDHWHSTVKAVLARAMLTMPDFAGHQKGGKRGLHTEHLSHLLAPMQVLQRTHLGAQW